MSSKLEKVIAKAIKKRGGLSDYDGEWVDADAKAYARVIKKHFVVTPKEN